MPIWSPPDQGSFPSGESFLHLWRFSLADDRFDHRFQQELAADELARADRLLSQAKRLAFVRARGWLRHILSFYLKDSPSSHQFLYNSYGKPCLDKAVSPGLEFNLSHSKNLGLLAVSSGEVGADVEQVRAELDIQDISQRFFDADEQQALNRFGPRRRQRGFFRLWTRKEAHLKMIGSGFSNPKSRIERAPFVRHFHVGRDYVAAVSCRQIPQQLRYFEGGSADPS